MVRPIHLLGIAVLTISPLGAALITFDPPPAGNPTPPSYIESGFMFASGHFHHIGSPAACAFGGCVDNGTGYISEEAGSLGLPIVMTAVGGGPFALTSFDGAEVFLAPGASFPNATHIDLFATVFGGGVLTTSFALDGVADGLGGAADFQSFVLPAGWGALTSVTFSGSIVGAAAGGISLDNVVAAAAVPEPGTILLLGTALLGLAAISRRRSGRD